MHTTIGDTEPISTSGVFSRIPSRMDRLLEHIQFVWQVAHHVRSTVLTALPELVEERVLRHTWAGTFRGAVIVNH